jgi:hypothetical protein
VIVDLKSELLSVLHGGRATMLAKLDGLSEYDRRRPATPTGTNLLGLVKHLAGLEYGYLGTSFGRPPAEPPSWFRDDPYSEIDMWATPDESSAYITTVYRQACAHSDTTIAELDLDSPGHVAHWPDGHRETTLGVLLIRMLAEQPSTPATPTSSANKPTAESATAMRLWMQSSGATGETEFSRPLTTTANPERPPHLRGGRLVETASDCHLRHESTTEWDAPPGPQAAARTVLRVGGAARST